MRTPGKRGGGDPFWPMVDRRVVEDFLGAFRGYTDEPNFGGGRAGGLILQNIAEIKNGDTWDVAYISGSGPEVTGSGLPTDQKASVRDQLELGTPGGDGIPFVGFPNRRVAAGQDLRSLVPLEAKGSDDGRTESKGDRALAREVLERPALLLYTVVSNLNEQDPPDKKVHVSLEAPLVAAVVATPKLTTEEEYEELVNGRGVRWKVNRVYARRQLGMSMSVEDDADEDEDF